MTTYEINQLIVLVEKHRVEAQSAAEAVVKVFDGESLLIDIGIADLCHERGLPAGDYPALVAELRQAGIMMNETVIPSISNIEEVGDARLTMPKDAEVAFGFDPAD